MGLYSVGPISRWAFIRDFMVLSKIRFSEKILVLKKQKRDEKVIALENLTLCRKESLLRKCSCSADLFILNKFALRKSSCSEKVAPLKNYLYSRNSFSVKYQSEEFILKK